VYDSVDMDVQTYVRRDVTLTIGPSGAASVTMARGKSKESPTYRCEASGKLQPVEKMLELAVASSTCTAAKEGSRSRFSVDRVSACLIQLNVKKGKAPFEVEQIAMRREGCR
jgi:hypothetical protein